MANVKEKELVLEEGEKMVFMYDEVTVTGAEKAKYLEPGKKYQVHPEHAKALMANGEAIKFDITKDKIKDKTPTEFVALSTYKRPEDRKN